MDATQKSGGKVSTNVRAFQARFEIRTKILSYFQILVEINSPEYQEMPKHNWTSQEDKRLKELMSEGLTAGKIQAREELFRNLSTSAIQSRITKFKQEKKDEINGPSQDNGK